MSNKRLALRDTVRINDDVVFRELEGEAVLLNLETGVYFGLNEVGTRIWSLLQERVSLKQVLERLPVWQRRPFHERQCNRRQHQHGKKRELKSAVPQIRRVQQEQD
jgi:hypothetical protein